MDFIQSVQEFNEIGGNKNEFSPRMVAMYIGLQLEEMAEKLDSLPLDYEVNHLSRVIDSFADRFKKGEFDRLAKNIDRVEALDADIDIAVVSFGAAHALGANVHAAADEVCASNMSKFVADENGMMTALRDANGKIQKGPHFFRPDLSKFV